MVPEFTKIFSLDSQLYTGALVLFVSILLARIAPLPRNLQPLEWLSQVAKNLSAKVNHVNRAPSQQLIAGTLAMLLLIIPFWAVISFLVELAEFPWFFETVIIYLCLQDDHFRYIANEVAIAIKRDNKPHARSLLLPWVSRSTASLSNVGLCKTTIERLSTTSIYGTVSAIVFFAIGGVPLLIIARMIKQIESVWPVYNPQYRYFGMPVYVLSTLVHYIPAKLWSLSLAIQGGPKSLMRLLAPKVNTTPLNEYQTCEVVACALAIELGGPVKFNKEKVDMPKVTYGKLPDENDLLRAVKLNSVAFSLWTLAIVILPSIWGLLRVMQG
ncbi:cobalamin biosynthesis protein [Shewanella schlegeliana]|uniref:Cobalamin biosynthesis protein n=1 Tax=Shewanella schlegeliana TaxID=190308 RepID=A0ABS1SW11_9GAMM|nr:cobalamin biosynthesis protein [Shewanella schlegeliana]MBL4912215.1 cobalamin biosynthesis protein [Shewanella schlegeliana]MCL1110698.1 cobalamin biosynthesis protein [Shewanella schlegeliana]GIU22589.1 cobalamin biosynthesis protein CbiB [Shewanella schlegeliana]